MNSTLQIGTKMEHIIFPGGGIFFWWQAGVVKALQQQYDLGRRDIIMSGASAGSITCILAACSVDMDAAMDAALRLSDTAGIFTQRRGLAGIWGDLIEKWLHEMLPDDCHVICSNRVNISVTTITTSFMPLHRRVINTFTSKQDIIDACLASVHVPYFIDGKFSRTYRGDTCVDGSFLFFLHNIPWSVTEQFDGTHRAMMVYHRNDKKLMKRKWGMFQTIDKESVLAMFSMGYNYGIQHRKQKQYKFDTPAKPMCVYKVGDNQSIYLNNNYSCKTLLTSDEVVRDITTEVLVRI
jgi:predicted acylesterase/phospholipase RssA